MIETFDCATLSMYNAMTQGHVLSSTLLFKRKLIRRCNTTRINRGLSRAVTCYQGAISHIPWDLYQYRRSLWKFFFSYHKLLIFMLFFCHILICMQIKHRVATRWRPCNVLLLWFHVVAQRARALNQGEIFSGGCEKVRLSSLFPWVGSSVLSGFTVVVGEKNCHILSLFVWFIELGSSGYDHTYYVLFFRSRQSQNHAQNQKALNRSRDE